MPQASCATILQELDRSKFEGSCLPNNHDGGARLGILIIGRLGSGKSTTNSLQRKTDGIYDNTNPEVYGRSDWRNPSTDDLEHDPHGAVHTCLCPSWNCVSAEPSSRRDMPTWPHDQGRDLHGVQGVTIGTIMRCYPADPPEDF